ncbi:hypothetical protein BGX27_002589 [Mortierella sp. AM989]|nr:hypothetical protein BGX27_002589 [Mortierella sp. AM989]
MANMEEGTYRITRPDSQALSTMGIENNSVGILGEPFEKGVQEWQLARNSDGAVSLRGLGSQLFLSLEDSDDVIFHRTIQHANREQRWRLTEGSIDGKMYIEHPDGRLDDDDMPVIDLGMLAIYGERSRVTVNFSRSNEFELLTGRTPLYLAVKYTDYSMELLYLHRSHNN